MSGATLSYRQGTLDLGDGRAVDFGRALGRGSMATVYEGLLRSGYGVARPVAVKLFSAVASEEAEQILLSIARTVRRVALVDHPNVARVYECGAWQRQPYVIGELVAGVPLAELCGAYAASDRRLPLDLALFIACEVAEALSGARLARAPDGTQLGVLHHSLSPREVLLSFRGEVKVTDFEMSNARGASSSIRDLGAVRELVTAMSPEVAQGAPGDARSDVFSFGVLLRELLIGPRFPHTLTNAEAACLAREGYMEPITFQPQLPEGLVSILDRALAVEPSRRFASASLLAAELRREAFALGVGDGRYFLRRELERRWPHTEETTAEHARPEGARGHGGQVVRLPRRR